MKASKVGERNKENYVIFGIFAFDETFEFIDRTFLFSDRDISVVLQQRSHPRRVNGGNVLTKFDPKMRGVRTLSPRFISNLIPKTKSAQIVLRKPLSTEKP